MSGQNSLEPDEGYPVIPPPPPEDAVPADAAPPPYGMPTAPPYAAPAPPPYGVPQPPQYGASQPPYAGAPQQHAGAPQPPYGGAPQQPYGTPAQPYPAPAQTYAGAQLPPPPVWGGQPPASAARPTTDSPRWLTPVIVLAILAGIVVLVVLVSSLLSTSLFASPRAPEPPVTTASAVPQDENPPAEAGGIADRLQAKIDEYRTARQDGTLWDRLPHTDANDTAVIAFLYLLTDMQVAASWGVDDATAAQYTADAADLEQKLLAQQPLGSDVNITFETRTFHYDGTTGEGGYTDN